MKVLLTLCLMFLAACLPLTGLAQTTKFTYQGQLTDSGMPQANYQMRFRLFGALVAGSQIGSTIENPAVAVDDGIFSVNLDFGANPFPGADRYLEIAVRRNAGESYTVLSPRQQIASSPYAIRTLSAQSADLALDSEKLGGLDASEYVTTATVGNAFIRNGTTLQDADFNIDGNGLIGGNLGVGITNPGARLVVSTDTAHATNNTAYFEATTIGPHASNIHYGTTGDWYIRSAAGNGNVIMQDTGGNVGIGTSNPNAKLSLIGNATQDLSSRGFPKAMVYVNQVGTILRCYNGTNGSSSGGCGFSVSHTAEGPYFVNFGFDITNRFYVATPISTCCVSGQAVSHAMEAINSTTLLIWVYDIEDDGPIVGATNRPVMVVVY